MRIARVLTRLNLGGPARQVLAADPLLGARGHVVRVFAGTPEPGEGDLFAEARAAGIDVVRVPGLRRGVAPVRDLWAGRHLRRLLAEFRPDVLHTHASKAGSLGRRAVRRWRDVARVHSFHGHVLEGYFPEPLSRALVAYERRLGVDTDRVVAVSHSTADDLVRLGIVPEEKLVVVPPGVELSGLVAIDRSEGGGSRRAPALDSPRALMGARAGDFVVGVVGRLAPVKRPELAIEVFQWLASRYPALHLVFVGDGAERRSLERRIQALGPEALARVHLLGAVSEMEPVWRDLDALLLTSRSEGLPVALIEAAAAGLPAVATPVGGVPEVVVHERTGYLGETADELAYGLAQLLDDRAAAAAMGARARLRVRQRHGAQQLADRLDELYRAVGEERRCAS